MPSNNARKRLRKKLFEDWKGRCCYCDCLCSLTNEVRPDQATVEHVQSKAIYGNRRNEKFVVLACRECNQKMNKKDLGLLRAWKGTDIVSAVKTAKASGQDFVEVMRAFAKKERCE